MTAVTKTQDQLFNELKTTVQTAGELALSYFGKDIKIETKPDGSQVSEADIAVNDHLQNTLTALDPTIGWLSEESPPNTTRRDKKRLWVVDPIDGTSSFLRHEPDWTISVALVENGHPTLAALYNPPRGELYLAHKENGATLNDAQLQTNEGTPLKDAEIITSKSHFNRVFKNISDKPRFFWRCSMAYRIALVAAGKVDATLSLTPKSDWDIAAAHLILEEAGGQIGTAEGEKISYNRQELRHPSVVAASNSLYSSIIKHASKM